MLPVCPIEAGVGGQCGTPENKLDGLTSVERLHEWSDTYDSRVQLFLYNLKRSPHYIRHTLGFEYFKLVTWRRCKPSKLEELRFLPISDNEVLRLLRELSRELRKSRRLSGGGISGQSHLLLIIVAYTDLRLEEITNTWETYVKRVQRKIQPFDGS